MKTTAVFFVLLISWQTKAAVITESFLTTQNKESSTAVWNTATGFVHPTLKINGYQAIAGPVTSGDFSVGDGSDGSFNVSTYANFGTVAGNVITINALDHSTLNFTNFTLDSGYTLTAINGPLIIHSLSTVVINGTINCSGGNGSAATGALGGAGGIGRCGGSNGGRGGNDNTSGTGGLPLTGLVSGGGGGSFIGAALGSGGGGGGSYSGNNGVIGTNSASPATNTGGAAGSGATGANHDFTILNGSPGGGGGSGSGTSSEGGGGGGAGGGTVVIHAVGNVTISNTGFILARGGNGGTANDGGGGGGGAGGSVKVFTAGNLHLDTGTDIDVNAGAGAVTVTGNAGDGGAGAFGRTWSNYSAFSGSGSESHASSLLSLGTIQYNTASQVAVSKMFDTSSTLAEFQSISASPASPDIVIEVSGSNDGFISDNSGWLPSTSIATLNKRRFLKFRITLTNSNATTPTQIDDVQINYAPGIKEDFQFKSGCGRIGGLPPPTSSSSLTIFLLCLLPLLISMRLKTVRTQKKN